MIHINDFRLPGDRVAPGLLVDVRYPFRDANCGSLATEQSRVKIHQYPLSPATADRPMTAMQAATLKRLRV
jgi:hypothetical protein